MKRAVVVMTLVAGCASPPATRPAASLTASSATSSQPSEQRTHAAVVSSSTQPSCRDAAIAVADGAEQAWVCPDDARARGLTIVDLGEDWTPTLFAPTADGAAPSYRATYLAFATEHDRKGKATTGEDALGELYGVVPAMSIVRSRLADDARHACNAAIDTAQVATITRALSQDDKAMVATTNLIRGSLAAQLERERKARKLDTVAELATVPQVAARYTRWKALDDPHTGLLAVQARLRCEGFLGAKDDVGGEFTWRTGNAIELYQRRNFLMPNERLDPETREAMTTDSHELDFRLALRVLRERVTAGAGLIEDGTAGAGPVPVFGRMLDPAEMRAARGGQPMADAAPDLIDAATEAAARQLGWTDAAATRAFLDRHPGGVRVALALPRVPAYHTATMDLAAEVDRGDVYYDEIPIARRVAHRPTMILYAVSGGGRIPLVRWPTTIGGWADQRLADGSVVQKWKESDIGPRVWRDLFAGPTWLPPPSTPDRDLVVNQYNGHYDLKRSVMGPGPHAAYGMMLLVHSQPIKLKDGTVRFDDNGIGTHGSASVTSIVNGTSHGCHRLYNQLAVRLADFLLQHHEHVARGEEPVGYRRIVAYKGEVFQARIDTRGFRYELTPPVPVNVLPGRILSARKVPPRDSAPAKP